MPVTHWNGLIISRIIDFYHSLPLEERMVLLIERVKETLWRPSEGEGN